MHTSCLLFVRTSLTLPLDAGLLEPPKSSKLFHVLTKVACSTVFGHAGRATPTSTLSFHTYMLKGMNSTVLPRKRVDFCIYANFNFFATLNAFFTMHHHNKQYFLRIFPIYYWSQIHTLVVSCDLEFPTWNDHIEKCLRNV